MVREEPIPTQITSVKTFFTREDFRKVDGRWQSLPQETEGLAKQVEAWLKETQAQVLQVSSPSVTIEYDEGDTIRRFYIGLTVLYAKAVEGIDDQVRRIENPSADPEATGAGLGEVEKPTQSGDATVGDKPAADEVADTDTPALVSHRSPRRRFPGN